MWLNELNQQIDLSQERNLNSWKLSNESLLDDLLNRQIDSLQSRVINDDDLSDEQKEEILQKLISYIDWLWEWEKSLEDIVLFFKSIDPENNVLSSFFNIPKYDSNWIPIVIWLDEDAAISFDAEVKKILSDEIWNLDRIKRIYYVYLKYSSYSNQEHNKSETSDFKRFLEEQWIDTEIAWFDEISLYWPRLSEDLNDWQLIIEYATIEEQTWLDTSRLIDLLWQEVAIDFLEKKRFLAMNKKQRSDFMKRSWETQDRLRREWLALNKDALLYSKDNDINWVKADISWLLTTIESEEIQEEVRYIYFVILDYLSWSWLSAREALQVLSDFKESIIDEVPWWNYMRSVNDLASLTSSFNRLIAKNKFLWVVLKKTKVARIIITDLANDFNLKETWLFLTTFLPFWIWNGLDLAYGLASLKTWKSVITWKPIPREQVIEQIIVSTIWLWVDLLSSGTLWTVFKWSLKLLKGQSKIWKVIEEIIVQIKNAPRFKELISWKKSLEESMSSVIQWLRNTDIGNVLVPALRWI